MSIVKDHIEHKHKFILCGGGTGGHLYPAIAIAEKLKEKIPDSEILFVGIKGKQEMEIIPSLGYNIRGLWLSGFQRKNMIKNLSLPFKLLSSLRQSRKIIKEFQPDLVIGTGGYASFPIIYSAYKKHIPSVIQEQNFFPGITNRYLSKYANIICVAFEGMEKYFPNKKIIISGNPVRESLSHLNLKDERYFVKFNLDKSKPVLAVLGGSLGSGTINTSILNGIQKLIENDIQVLWQCGNSYYNKLLSELPQDTLDKITIFPFIDSIESIYSVADLVVCRAGALTLSELAITCRPAILIPSPNVAEDHQTKNALSLSEKGAAILLQDVKAKENLISTILDIIRDKIKLQELSTNISKLAKPDASEIITNEIIKLIS